MVVVSYVVYRSSSGTRRIDYFGKSSGGKTNKVTTKTLSKKEFEKNYGTGRQGVYDAAELEAKKINQQSTKQQQTFIDPTTGRTLSPFEAQALKDTGGGMTTASGGVAYSTITVEGGRRVTNAKEAATQRFDTRGTVTAATPEEARAARRQSSVFGRTKTAFLSGLGLKKGSGELYRGEYSPTGQRITAAERIGYAGGLVGSIASVSKAPGAYSKLTAPAVTKYAGFLSKQSLSTARVVNLGTSLGVTYAATEVVQEGLTLSTKATSPRTREFFSNDQAEAAYKAGIEAEKQSSPWLKRQAMDVPGVNKLVRRDEKAFRSGVVSYAQGAGIKDITGLEKSARQYENIRTGAFAAGSVSANTFSEIGGQVSVAAITPAKTFGARFMQGGLKIASQGFIEGSSVVVAEQTASGRNPRTFNYPAIGAGAILGGVSAGAIGGTIYAAKPVVGKGLLGAAYVVDPYEAVGDVTADAASRVITTTPSLSSRAAPFTPTNAVNPTSATSVLQPSATITQSKAFSLTTTPTTPVSTNTFTSSFTNPFVRTSTFVRTTPTNVFVNAPVNTPTSTNVFTPTSTNTFTPTAPVTFTGRPGLPPLPLMFGGGGGGFKKGVFDSLKQPRAYQPSLTASVLGIRGKKPSAALLKTGLTVRPL